MSKVITDIMEERTRQIFGERWTADHDDNHDTGELAMAGACYARYAFIKNLRGRDDCLSSGTPVDWPWSCECWKQKNPRQDLIRAAALIVAEIDKIDRIEERERIKNVPPVDRSNAESTKGESRIGHEHEHSPVPDPSVKTNGQHPEYWVLSEEERAKGFLRPVRCSYIHTGVIPEHPTRLLTKEEKELSVGRDYVCFMPNPGSSKVGRFFTAAKINGCNTKTTMTRAIAETYARDPSFYGSTFCCKCNAHFPVEEFVWDGTKEVLGS